jgi:hypothetical protein
MDVSVCLTTPPFIGVVGFLLRRIRGTKLIIWNMDVYPEIAVVCGYLKRRSPMRRIATIISRHLYRTASCIISLGDRMTERLIKDGANPEKITTIHNWAPGAAFAQLAPAVPFEEATVPTSQDIAAMSLAVRSDTEVAPALVAHSLPVSKPLK